MTRDAWPDTTKEEERMRASTIPWDETRLSQVEAGARYCDDACGADVQSLVAEVRKLRQQIKIALDALGEVVHIGDGCEVEACQERNPATIADDALTQMSVLE